MNVAPTKLPVGLLPILAKVKLDYSTPETLFECVWAGDHIYAGVFGDGANGCYEWFVYKAYTGELHTSNAGYGSTAAALAEALNHPMVTALIA